MYYDFINLNNVSPILREAVEDIQMILRNDWNYEENLENERLLNILKDSDSLITEVMCLKEKDSGPVLLLQMAIYRFCKIHSKDIFKSIEGRCFYNEITEGFKEWERGFWIQRDIALMFAFGTVFDSKTISEKRNFYRKAKPRKKEDNGYYLIEETIKKALEDKETIKEVEKLRVRYASLKTKAEKMNARVKCEGDRKLDAIQDMKKIIEIMERNLQGKLTPWDIVELEKYIPAWDGNMQMLEELFKNLD